MQKEKRKEGYLVKKSVRDWPLDHISSLSPVFTVATIATALPSLHILLSAFLNPLNEFLRDQKTSCVRQIVLLRLGYLSEVNLLVVAVCRLCLSFTYRSIIMVKGTGKCNNY